MKKPDFSRIATQNWEQLRRFPTSDALADAVLVHALYGILWTPFSFRKYFLRDIWKEKWAWLFLPLDLVLTPLWLLWRLDVSLRLRRDEKKAWRTAIINSSIMLVLFANGWLIKFWMREEPRELTESELEDRTDEQRGAYKANWAAMQARFEERPWQSPWKPKQIFWGLVLMAFHLNVLFRAFQPATRARFRTP